MTHRFSSHPLRIDLAQNRRSLRATYSSAAPVLPPEWDDENDSLKAHDDLMRHLGGMSSTTIRINFRSLKADPTVKRMIARELLRLEHQGWIVHITDEKSLFESPAPLKALQSSSAPSDRLHVALGLEILSWVSIVAIVMEKLRSFFS